MMHVCSDTMHDDDAYRGVSNMGVYIRTYIRIPRDLHHIYIYIYMYIRGVK